jgi:hypothetical protein
MRTEFQAVQPKRTHSSESNMYQGWKHIAYRLHGGWITLCGKQVRDTWRRLQPKPVKTLSRAMARIKQGPCLICEGQASKLIKKGEHK